MCDIHVSNCVCVTTRFVKFGFACFAGYRSDVIVQVGRLLSFLLNTCVAHVYELVVYNIEHILCTKLNILLSNITI